MYRIHNYYTVQGPRTETTLDDRPYSRVDGVGESLEWPRVASHGATRLNHLLATEMLMRTDSNTCTNIIIIQP